MNDVHGEIIAVTDEGWKAWNPQKGWVDCLLGEAAAIDCGYDFDWADVPKEIAEARIADINENGYGKFEPGYAVKEFTEKFRRESLSNI